MRRLTTVLAAAMVVAGTAVASAQTLGTFSWQTQPYCNVVTLTIVQVGTQYQLAGADDLCGAGSAPVTGTALAAGSGVTLGFTVSLPSGRAAQITAAVNLATVSGPWNDADGNTGTFAFNASATGSPRPAPANAAAITTTQLAPSIYGGTGAATTVARSDHTHDARYYTKGESDARKTSAAFSDSFTVVDITSATIVGTVVMAAPGPGVLVATGVTSILDGTGTEYGCSISTTGAFQSDYGQYVNLATPIGTITTVRHIPVTAGSFTVWFICRSSFGGTGQALRPKLSVLFVPS